MRLVYDIGIRFYWLVIRIVSPWNRKAGLWLKGRRGWHEKLGEVFGPGDRVIWFHCASLGEFEQGRPVIEACREHAPGHRILLTFFSPSGYEKRKSYEGADHVMYLPLDTRRNARRFLKAAAPEMAVFIKYEFWYHYLRSLNRENIPVYLASGIFRPGQLFFRWYGGWYRKFLGYFTHIFVQQQSSLELLEKFGIREVSVAGDTRFDRVCSIAGTTYEHPALERFISGSATIVAGSTWEKDEQLLEQAFRQLPASVRWIIAPHELSEEHLDRLRRKFPGSILFTEMDKRDSTGRGDSPGEVNPSDGGDRPGGLDPPGGGDRPGDLYPPGGGDRSHSRVVIVNTIGHLSYVYRYGTLAYIGGGFGKGIHNILEAAVYGIPVLFGPEYGKFPEAVELAELGGAFPVHDGPGLLSTIHQHLEREELLKSSSTIAKAFVHQRTGATENVMNRLCEKF